MVMRDNDYLNILIDVCKQSKLIETVDEIDGLIDIEGYDFKVNLSNNNQIKDAICWAFENDRLTDFYNEYWEEVFIHSDLASFLMSGSISHNNSMLNMEFSLYRINSKNNCYYKVEKSGYLSDGLWDDGAYFETTDDISKEAEVIEAFKDKCEFIATNFDEFDDDIMAENGIQLNFSLK